MTNARSPELPLDKPRPPSRDARPASPSETGAERVIDSGAVLEGRAEVVIRHNGRHYRLRATRLGKLILTA